MVRWAIGFPVFQLATSVDGGVRVFEVTGNGVTGQIATSESPGSNAVVRQNSVGVVRGQVWEGRTLTARGSPVAFTSRLRRRHFRSPLH